MKIKILTTALVAVGVLSVGSMFLTQVNAYQGDASKVGPNHTEEREVAMDKVMATNDYDGWKQLMTVDGRSPGVLRKVDTQAEFEKFAEAHRLQDAGKTDEASAIRAELGMGNGNGMNNGKGNGNGNGTGCINQ